MIRLHDLSMMPGHTPAQLTAAAAGKLRIAPSTVTGLTVVRRSVDARKKPDIRLIYTLDVTISGNEAEILRRSRCSKASLAAPCAYVPPVSGTVPAQRPVVVGFGPAGMFAALVLAMAGWKPLVLERGEDAQTRHERVARFFKTGQLDTGSNVQFGEGGAGTFSDGKLNTGVHNPRIGWILRQLVRFGAREDILYDAKPHVGTDVLLRVVQNLRQEVVRLGGEVRFGARVTDLQVQDGRLSGVVLDGGEVIPCCRAVLALGHSARDTFAMLHSRGIVMEPKPFAMGVRIEHPQSKINLAQYGAERPDLPPADYKLVCHLPERTVYTFCMCPGGYVVAAASEAGGVVTNGMSNADRDGKNANAALLVSVSPADFPGPDPLAGMRWQRQLEQRAFRMGGYRAPAQRVGDFLGHVPSTGPGTVEPTYRPGVTWCDLHDVLPPLLTDALEQALPMLGSRLSGFDHPDAVLTAPETRSSSPVRILRGTDRQASLPGLYPAGEGAGYAGGIMSAAIDGILTAEAVLGEEAGE